MTKPESKTRQILRYLSQHRGQMIETQELVELFEASPWTIKHAVDMNPLACRNINFGNTVEVFDEEGVELRSTTSDVRETRYKTQNEANSSRGHKSWQGNRTLKKLNGDTIS
jgi:hypothetical protein